MNSGQQFKPERGLESFNEMGHLLKSGLGVVILSEKSLSVLDRAGDQFDLFIRGIAAIGITRNKMSLDGSQNVAKIFCIGSIRRFCIKQPQWLTRFLHEVH